MFENVHLVRDTRDTPYTNYEDILRNMEDTDTKETLTEKNFLSNTWFLKNAVFPLMVILISAL